MNLEAQVTIATTNSVDRKKLSLFQAVRLLSDAESAKYEIILEGKTLSDAEIKRIVQSEEYMATLLAFDERR
jgi:hypothetical protein